jgi:arsenate reductase
MTIRIFHNPRCSKSRATLALLQERGLEPEITLYLETPPDAGELRSILNAGESEYLDQGLDDETLSEDALIAAMVNSPRLIERPIVLANGRAAIGRPPESVLDIV